MVQYRQPIPLDGLYRRRLQTKSTFDLTLRILHPKRIQSIEELGTGVQAGGGMERLDRQDCEAHYSER